MIKINMEKNSVKTFFLSRKTKVKEKISDGLSGGK